MVQIKDDKTALRLAVLWIAGWTVLRAVYATGFMLTPDETYYWQWGRHLDWGYHDQAPLIGWAIGFCTRLFGDTEFAVRLPSVLAMGIAAAYLAAFAYRWFGARTAWAVAVASQGLLLFNLGGVLATADGLQAAAWAAAAYHTARAGEDDAWPQWLLAGFWLGFGLLARFTMVIFGVSALGYFLFCPVHRNRLRSVKPYVAATLALAMFSPVLWWNAANGWNSARHVCDRGGAGQTGFLHIKYIGDFVGGQIALLSPVVFAGVVWAWALAFRQRRQPQSWPVVFCCWTSLPMVLLFLGLSLRTRVYGNWPAAGYLTAGILVAAFLAERPVFWRWLVGTAYMFSLGLLTLVWLQSSAWALPINPRLDRLAKELLGWDRLGVKAATMLAALPEPRTAFLFATRYQEASELAFYTPGQPATVSINRWHRPNAYDYWWKDEQLIGRDAIGIITAPAEHRGHLREVFTRVEPPEALPVYRGRSTTPVKTYYLYRCYGFKGGLRYVAPPVN